MKSTKTQDFTPLSEYDLDTLFTIVLIEENKSGKLGPPEVGEDIVSMPFDEFLDCLNCAEKDGVWWSFKRNNLVGKSKREEQIWTKKEYALFTDIISRPEIKRTVYLRLANSKKDNKDKEEENSSLV